MNKSLYFSRYQPSKALVITTWRSGSTFLSAYLNAHPGSYNHVEPLNYLKVSRLTENGDSRKDKALDVIKNFYNCKYDYAKSKLHTYVIRIEAMTSSLWCFEAVYKQPPLRKDIFIA